MLPSRFLSYISQYPQLSPLGSDLLTAPPVSVRLNPAKGPLSAPSSEKVPWCDLGFYLPSRPQFTYDPSLHQGRYYVQDASSMAICAALKQVAGESPLKYLDACAAPGGKTTCALSALPAGSLVVANEYDYKRAEILCENIAKWGVPGVMVSRGDTRKFKDLPGFFDIVAVDAPCSGEGMMRKDPQAVEQWSEGLVKKCAEIQRQILANVWGALRPGGYIIYSTCTFNRSENEENVDWLVEEYGALPIKIDQLEGCQEIVPGIDTPYPCYRFLPGRVKGEGLFLCVMRKPESEHEAKIKKAPKDNSGKSGKGKISEKQKNEMLSWLSSSEQWSLLEKEDEIYAVPSQWASLMTQLSKTLDAIMPGLHLATIKGKDIVPSQSLSLSTALRREAFPSVELTLEESLTYLRREAIAIDAPRGYVLVTYQSYPLGFVKNLGTRANNLYPKAWRILH